MVLRVNGFGPVTTYDRILRTLILDESLLSCYSNETMKRSSGRWRLIWAWFVRGFKTLLPLDEPSTSTWSYRNATGPGSTQRRTPSRPKRNDVAMTKATRTNPATKTTKPKSSKTIKKKPTAKTTKVDTTKKPRKLPTHESGIDTLKAKAAPRTPTRETRSRSRTTNN